MTERPPETGDGAAAWERRSVLVRIAYHHIATRGLEGLRVRAVAAEAGINHATLLYYFPTKEALIQGVVEHLLREFQISRVPRPATPTPLEEVRLEFEDMRRRLHAEPELMVVLIDLAARARRDPTVAKLLGQLDDTWRAYLAALLRRGVAQGAFRPDLDPWPAATALMAQFKGLAIQSLGQSDPMLTDALVDELLTQVERAIRA